VQGVDAAQRPPSLACREVRVERRNEDLRLYSDSLSASRIA
jgi:hypothetical protein